MNILMTGGTGFIGTQLSEYLINRGFTITVLTRNSQANKKDIEFVTSLNDIHPEKSFHAVINLAGASISNRWSKSYKTKLINSRVALTKNLVEFISAMKVKPTCLISASAIGYYGSQSSNPLDEASSPNKEFTHELCRAWEEAAQPVKDAGVRLCIMRIGIVLGQGGALKKMLPAFRLGLGGPIGSGEQYMSWIQIKDLLRIIEKLVSDDSFEGVYNATAPNPVTNKEFSIALGKALSRPAIFPMPAFMVKLLFGEMGDRLLLKGQNVLPGKLLSEGFDFNFKEINSALAESLK